VTNIFEILVLMTLPSIFSPIFVEAQLGFMP